ncbi:glycoside hydrolase family 25 protein [Aestuariicoccus sp. MJ-SS9]|uniref:glycoside hydrolase family 25 protein n=1 Tax=Aestuariicoccus sp. MJ-SS9 TaxID=3079855 RepID=UPI00290B7CAB|nr:GH25 family lysozyme [Aestuariicoccus sp. MJ-SS9]MDU8911711.1 GH25 family lysozyme [Aestuariicoccus sp. MJ-SS9]
MPQNFKAASGQSGQSGQDAKTRPNTLSRGQRRTATGAASPVTGLTRDFTFPDDLAPTHRFGVDVSHHQGTIDWPALARSGPRFCYVKATEGQSYRDPRFVANIKAAAAQGLAVGSYHFLNANVPADAQAEAYLKARDDAGVAQALAPCLDLEWDYLNGTDRWADKSAATVADAAKVWLDRVAKETGQVPIIYTNLDWWTERLGSAGAQLQGHPIWMSRYGGYATGTPNLMDGFTWRYWQFTDRATVPGITGAVDANVANADSDTVTNAAAPTPAAGPACTVTEAFPEVSAPDADTLKKIYDLARALFGSLDDSGVAMVRVLVNTSDPRRLARIAAGDAPRDLSASEKTAFFDLGRSDLGGGKLTQQQVDYLNILLAGADPDQVRACLLDR